MASSSSTALIIGSKEAPPGLKCHHAYQSKCKQKDKNVGLMVCSNCDEKATHVDCFKSLVLRDSGELPLNHKSEVFVVLMFEACWLGVLFHKFWKIKYETMQRIRK